jgi:flagellar biogenesis protein FliO
VSASPTNPPLRPRAKRAAPRAAAVTVPRSVEDETPSPNYALRLTEALQAISAIQSGPAAHHQEAVEDASPFADVLEAVSVPTAPRVRRGLGRRSDDNVLAGAQVPLVLAGEDVVEIARVYRPPEPRVRAVGESKSPQVPEVLQPDLSGPSFTTRLLNGFDQLPPIRLPIGPAISWRLAIPALILLVVVMAFVSRSSSSGDSQGVRLRPAQPTATVVPLFANPQPSQADVSTPNAPVADPTVQPQLVATPAAQPLGVQDPGGMSFDVLDVGLKLVAVLALAYGSLMLLKRTGFGGGVASKGSDPALGMRVVSSLVLAPNRTVHLVKVPGGKTLVVGATPNQVNLIADLGELADGQDVEVDGSFFDILKGKISP